MSDIGQREKATQQRVVKLLSGFGCAYLGDWTDRDGDRNIEPDLLRAFLIDTQGYDEALVTCAVGAGDRGSRPPALRTAPVRAHSMA